MRYVSALYLLWLAPALAADPLVVVEEGSGRARVGVHPEAGEWERRAAEDLVRYVEEMSGARLPLLEETADLERAMAGPAPLLLVGRAALEADLSLGPRLAALQKADPVLRSDAIVARRRGDRVYLAGGNDESHYYAAVELLRHWGCRWYLPTDFGASIPRKPTLTVDSLDVAWVPPFEVRSYWLSWYGDQSGRQEFMRRNRLNDLSVPAGHALGHYVDDLPGAGESPQSICLSDPATIRHVADRVMERFAEGAPAVSLGMDDGLYDLACASDAELAAGLWDKNFMSPALTDPFMALYNGVAELTQERFPGRRIGFLAYSNITPAAPAPHRRRRAPGGLPGADRRLPHPRHGRSPLSAPPGVPRRHVPLGRDDAGPPDHLRLRPGHAGLARHPQPLGAVRPSGRAALPGRRHPRRRHREPGGDGHHLPQPLPAGPALLGSRRRRGGRAGEVPRQLLGTGGGPHARLLAGDPAGLGGNPLPRARVLVGPHGLHAGDGARPGAPRGVGRGPGGRPAPGGPLPAEGAVRRGRVRRPAGLRGDGGPGRHRGGLRRRGGAPASEAWPGATP